jgi:hypothetical protein
MNRLFACAIIVNVVLLIGFIFLDDLTLKTVAYTLDSQRKTVLVKFERIVSFEPTYTTIIPVIQVGITAHYLLANYFGEGRIYGTSINLSLIWFIVTVAANLCLIWYLGIKRMSQPTKDSKTETVISGSP